MKATSQAFVEADGLSWFVETAGQGPVILLVHGTAASVHSWRDVIPLLATDERELYGVLSLEGHLKDHSSRIIDIERIEGIGLEELKGSVLIFVTVCR